MKIKNSAYGFDLISAEEIAELPGTLYLLEHRKTGAKLAFLDRDDRNMTFSIAFRTPPKDDTGVFHIIEHSVLCGSRKYPVKEPFVELLKGSLNTFLNAMTYEDRTVYPVASRCEKDFLNLTDIYLDAVFHPRMLECENIFLQEGWHYEYDGENLSYNGVVYNEMHGAYSSPDEPGSMELRRCLFSDGMYKYDSGGYPSTIPTLTYEDFVSAHSTYYHPSNAFIVLDGRVDTDKLLPLIASYLDEYEKKEINIEYPIHAPRLSPCVTLEFEPGGESGARVLLGYVYSSFDKWGEDLAINQLVSALAGTNEGQLKRAILDRGICEDVSLSLSHVRQSQITLELIDVKEDRLQGIEEEIEKIIRDIARVGVDKARLRATLGSTEFKIRERDFGALPAGIAYALAIYSSWIYGTSPTGPLKYEESIRWVREKIETDYFDKLLLHMTVDNPHRASVVMLPRKGYDSRVREELSEKMCAIRDSMTESELQAIKEKADGLKIWQQTPDTPEKLNTVPTLSISDITPPKAMSKISVRELDGAKVLLHEGNTGGITYLNIDFVCDDLQPSEIIYLSILSTLLKNLNTENYTKSALQNEIKSTLGSLVFGTTVYPTADGLGGGSVTLNVSSSAFTERVDDMARLIKEVLLKSDFSDRAVIKEQLMQTRSYMDEAMSAQGLTFALMRAGSRCSRAGALNELRSGFTAYEKIRDMCARIDEICDTLPHILSSLLSRICIKERMTVSVTDERAMHLAESVISAFPSGSVGAATDISFDASVMCDGLAVPTRVSHAAMKNVSKNAAEHLGLLRVAANILSYEYLWGEIRVKGGAYGAGLSVKKSGEVGAYSYRDPSPAASVEAIRKAPDFLRDLAKEKPDLTKYIIGSIGEYDILSTPRTRAEQAVYDYMVGWTEQKEEKLISDMLSVDCEKILLAADILEEAIECGSFCITANREVLEKITPPLSIIGTDK